jgi:hypothetical protein
MTVLVVLIGLALLAIVYLAPLNGTLSQRRRHRRRHDPHRAAAREPRRAAAHQPSASTLASSSCSTRTSSGRTAAAGVYVLYHEGFDENGHWKESLVGAYRSSTSAS